MTVICIKLHIVSQFINKNIYIKICRDNGQITLTEW